MVSWWSLGRQKSNVRQRTDNGWLDRYAGRPVGAPGGAGVEREEPNGTARASLAIFEAELIIIIIIQQLHHSNRTMDDAPHARHHHKTV
jgi:hypothetical protein